MEKSDFFYHLPKHLIAQTPLSKRTASRLMDLSVERNEIRDLRFPDIAKLLKKGDLLVFNDTRVIPARLFGEKETGGKIEILVERLLDRMSALSHIKASKSPKEGTEIIVAENYRCRVEKRIDDLFVIKFIGEIDLLKILETRGHVPLPPYIRRSDEKLDRDRYQTVYASHPGAIAAPTAGLHFDNEIISKIKSIGVNTCFITLHVGSGTFSPLRENDLKAHKMHPEAYEVSPEVVEKINRTRCVGGRIIAVGSTVARALESASIGGRLTPNIGETNLFITPGYKFNCIDAMLTNFHLPESSLLILICAFAGYSRVMNAYKHAVSAKYRFYSYGDAMFITKSISIQ